MGFAVGATEVDLHALHGALESSWSILWLRVFDDFDRDSPCAGYFGAFARRDSKLPNDAVPSGGTAVKPADLRQKYVPTLTFTGSMNIPTVVTAVVGIEATGTTPLCSL